MRLRLKMTIGDIWLQQDACNEVSGKGHKA